MAHHLLFVPGAGGAASFWHPLGALLPASWRKTYLGWPGLGHEPHEPALQPRARLWVLTGGDHMFARDRAAEIAPRIVEHLLS